MAEHIARARARARATATAITTTIAAARATAVAIYLYIYIYTYINIYIYIYICIYSIYKRGFLTLGLSLVFPILLVSKHARSCMDNQPYCAILVDIPV